MHLLHPLKKVSPLGRSAFSGGQPRGLLLLEPDHALFLANDVERAISADREKPGLETIFHFFDILLVKPDESVLNHVPGPLDVVQKGGGISQQGRFVVTQSLPHELLVTHSAILIACCHFNL